MVHVMPGAAHDVEGMQPTLQRRKNVATMQIYRTLTLVNVTAGRSKHRPGALQ